MTTLTQKDRKKWYQYLSIKPARHMFWAWITYQTVKGTLTTSLIWIPLLYTWLH